MDMAETIVSGTKTHRPLMQETVTEEDRQKAKIELKETEDIKKALLERFRQKISEVANFRSRMDDRYLLRYLRVKKFDVEQALELLIKHYRFRAENPDCFPVPSAVLHILRAGIFNYLPHRDHMGRAIFVVKMRRWDPKVVSFRDFVAAGNLLSEYVLDNPVTQINGYIGLWDFKDFTTRQSLSFCYSPKLLVKLIQDCFPGRLKIAYCVNCGIILQTVWACFKPLLREKYKNRVKMFSEGDLSVLHENVDPRILPAEYGGSLPPWTCDEINRLVREREQYFADNRNYGFRNNQNV